MQPFSENRAETVASWGEARLLTAIREWLGEAAPAAPFGMGDDCAVLPGGRAWNLLTNDALYYGRHFDASASPEAAGAKLLKRNLSDIASMGGTPGPAVIALLLPPRTRLDWLERFYRGLAAVATEYGVPVAGGDLTESTGELGGALTLLGHAGRPLLRTGARAGDRIAVTGELGGSLAGRHLDFTPRLAAGQWLATRPEVRAMIDVSDGLRKDLPAITPADCVAVISTGALPISAAARTAASTSGRDAVDHALCDGEDYELLFAIDGKTDPATFLTEARAALAIPLTLIGRFEAAAGRSQGAILDRETGKALASTGTDHHFKDR